MAYASTKQFAERSGIGIRIVDENVGTGDNSETDFDLDNDNVISGTYTISHAASGSNSFTALTETTHYTLDKESGRIILTASGVTTVGTDIIYATYWYTDNFSDSVISDLINAADDEIEVMTGRKWDTPVSVVEYRDGNPTLGYPTTDNPYALDYDKPDGIVLRKQPVTQVDALYFLSTAQPISKFFNFDSGTSTYTDRTDNVNSSTQAPFTLFDDAPATGDIIYISGPQAFLGLDVVLSTAGVDNGSTAIDWEYWNGSAWTDLTETDTDAGASIFTTSGKFTWTYPYGWAETTVNSVSGYWIRGTLTDDYSTDPVCATMTIRDSVSTVVETRNYNLADSTVYFTGQWIPHGNNNVRIDYQYGNSTTPSYITDLSLALASLRAFVNLSGGSFDDATSYTLGSKSVTIGEVYVNIREVIAQVNSRIDTLYNLVGKRAQIAVI